MKYKTSPWPWARVYLKIDIEGFRTTPKKILL
jgi:hypothetical protein